jgi:hypothetical protein
MSNTATLNRAEDHAEPSTNSAEATTLKARAIAMYLPQFHPIPENDAFWGRGFTEWTNVTNARALFRGHRQPLLPGELGFYDLRLPEVREQQAELAREGGIEAFCYWHYWFGNGKRALERIFDEVLESGAPAFPFCLGWANHSWSNRWLGVSDEVTIFEQTYPSDEDLETHLSFLTRAFSDRRYLRVDGDPLFLVYHPQQLPEFYVREIRSRAQSVGFRDVHLVGIGDATACSADRGYRGFIDHDVLSHIHAAIMNPEAVFAPQTRRLARAIRRRIPLGTPMRGVRLPYSAYRRHMELKSLNNAEYPMAVPNWDNTPRHGTRGCVLTGCSPEQFRLHLQALVDKVMHRTFDHRLIFIKSWNEWAEGNHMEPDRVHGRSWLEASLAALKC